MADLFPRTIVGGVSMPRMIMGTNWLLGWSHTGAAADAGIKEKYQKPEDFFPVFKAYLDRGVDALMGPISNNELGLSAIKYAEDKLGKKIILIDTPSFNVDDTPEARREAQRAIKKSREAGATFTLVHHASAEQLVNKNKREITRLPDYLSMIRDEGLIPGLSAHMPELVTYSDKNEYDVETYIQIFNCMGFFDAGRDRVCRPHHSQCQKACHDHQAHGCRSMHALCGVDLQLERHPRLRHGDGGSGKCF